MKLRAVAAACGLLFNLVGAESNVTNTESSHLILTGDFKPPQVFENANVVRNTNLEKGYVRETVNLVVTNIDNSPQSDYYLPFPYDVKGKVGGLEARDKKNPDTGKFKVVTAAIAESLDDTTTTQYYLIQFPQPLQPKAQLTLSISYHFLSSLTPLPASIKQEDRQYLTYSFSAYVPSAYKTLKQKTKLKFPSADVPEYTTTTGLISSADPEVKGSTFTYGPYETSKNPAGSTHPITVRYEFTKPILACSLLERDVEISQWGGNLATEERYWLRNDGATLIDHFSRVTWATQNYYTQAPTSALRELKVPLKPGSIDPYFTDDIGNVSTSHFRPNSIREVSLELKPRYPLFGGWKYSFRIGWNNALSSVLRKLKTPSDTYALSVPLIEGPKMPEGIQYEQLVLRIILPEGSKNVRWEAVGGTGCPTLSSEMDLQRTFMDTVGRTELKLKAWNVVDEARDVNVVVTYEYPFFAAFRKPLSIFLGVLSVFVVAWAVSTVDTSIGRRKA